MDPLSAIKMTAGPQLSGLGSDAVPSVATPSIPAAELSQINTDNPTPAVGGTQSTGSFSNLLGDFVGQVNDQQNAANAAVTGLLSGQNVSLHQVMISMEEANMSFQMMVEVRNKLLDSYQELMRMQV